MTISSFHEHNFFSKNAVWQLLALGFKTTLAAFQGIDRRFKG
jgi:hypothetical protein